MRDLLSGPIVRLTAIREEDLASIEKWFNDGRFMRFYDLLPAVPKQQRDVKQMLESFAGDPGKFIFAARDQQNDEIIGILGFDEVIWSNGVANLFIGIGDSRRTGKGFGREAVKLLVDFGFFEINMHRIQLQVIAYNQPAINLYEGLGFVREGVSRQAIHRDGHRFDLLLYGLLREEWEKGGAMG